MFYNCITGVNETDATETKHGRFFIKMGFAGFNSSANNRWGYASKARAEGAILRYQRAGEAHRAKLAADGRNF